MKVLQIGPRHDYAHGDGWSRKVSVDGVALLHFSELFLDPKRVAEDERRAAWCKRWEESP